MYSRPLILAAALLLAAPAGAADLASAKASGQVCEQTSGYLRANAGAPGDVQAMVNSINDKRRQEYEKIAERNNVTVDQVSRLTAEKVINRAPQHRCQ
jgi:uncharacterized protein YdbL (DUF1318 family)